jgi:hypothetical protein
VITRIGLLNEKQINERKKKFFYFFPFELFCGRQPRDMYGKIPQPLKIIEPTGKPQRPHIFLLLTVGPIYNRLIYIRRIKLQRFNLLN